MLLPTIKLDDRRWQDLVEEGRNLIPQFAPEWTDHNIHDPGITFVDLFAFLTEMQIFRLDRIPPAHVLKFLRLLGIEPRAPQPARTVLQGELRPEVQTLSLPAGVEFDTPRPDNIPIRFRSVAEIRLCQTALARLGWQRGGKFVDLTGRYKEGDPIFPFGEIPVLGDAFYLGFDRQLPTGHPCALYLRFTGQCANDEARRRIIDDQLSRKADCLPMPNPCREDQPDETPSPNPSEVTLQHHSVRLEWEFPVDQGGHLVWRRLDPDAGEVIDHTRSLSLNGTIAFRVTSQMAVMEPTGDGHPAYYLRCRLAEGEYDSPPQLERLFLNAIEVEQAVPVAPVSIGVGDGSPHQEFNLPEAPALPESLRAYTTENFIQRMWTRVADFDASGREDAHLFVDPTTGLVRTGDGEKGRVLPKGVALVAAYDTTMAERGNIPAEQTFRLSQSAHNRVLLGDTDYYQSKLELVTNPLAASGGEAAESLDHVEGRALETVLAVTRAVTVEDLATLARQTPGTCIARALVKTNVDIRYPCLKAPGVMTVIIVPDQRGEAPMPTPGLRRAVERSLNRRRVLGTRLHVAGPEYTRVTINAKAQILAGSAAAQVQSEIVARLRDFLHPLRGGPDRNGWPLGRDVYRSEILQVIDETAGVDFVISLELIANDGEPQCGNLCIGPCGLVYSGSHQIEVVENARR